MSEWEMSGDWMAKMFDRTDRHHKNIHQEFLKLLAEPCMEIPEVGDRVVVAVGLLSMGHLWVREEAIVEEVGATSYKVNFGRKYSFEEEDRVKWIHPALVTDVLRKKEE